MKTTFDSVFCPQAPIPRLAHPPVEVRRHRPNYDELADEVAHRAEDILNRSPPIGCVYLNPAATVLSTEPTASFFEAVRKVQADWCRRGTLFPRRVRRSPARWVNHDGPCPDKFARFLDRALCFTGVLFIGGRIVPPHEWTKAQAVAARNSATDTRRQGTEQR